MNTDPIADMLTRIRNAHLRNIETVELPYSKTKEAIALVLKEGGFLSDVRVFKPKDKSYKYLSLDLKYSDEGEPAIKYIDRESKPGLRKYKKVKEITPVLGGLGMFIVSTSRGILSSKDARKRNLGGEIICRVY
jgi:small subunit ribosomal protein S8